MAELKPRSAAGKAKPPRAAAKKTKAPVVAAKALKAPKPPKKASPTVDDLLAAERHPFEREVRAIREIIKRVNRNIAEEWKWRAPSFTYKGHMATFNLWERKRVHLIFHNGAILGPKLGILEGEYVDRRMVYFADMGEVQAKQAALVKAVKQWVRLMDAGVAPVARPRK